jgi:threonylcarbamoyladenosine tRNA methylthiotransferase MtaB
MVKVQDGCDAACAYCIVPRVRGAERSAPPDAVAARVAALAAAGAHEVILTGIHLGRYGHTSQPPATLAGLLERLFAETAVALVRLSSVEPLEFDAALLDLVAREPRLAPHFHVPLQSGSAAVLARMGRPYAPPQYLEVVERLAALRPLAALGADVIAGFPGETAAEFEETAALVAGSPLTYLHVFPFSPRPGTPAAAMRGRLPEREVARRARVLRELGRAGRRRHLEACRDHPLDAVVLRSGGGLAGSHVLTGNYISLTIPDVLPPNEAVGVRIAAIDPSGRISGILA